MPLSPMSFSFKITASTRGFRSNSNLDTAAAPSLPIAFQPKSSFLTTG
jgi:hypothetical protein